MAGLSITTLPMAERRHYQQLSDALTNCTAFSLKLSKDEDGDTVFCLMDGCNEQDGDPFPDLAELEHYIRNNEEVEQYLLMREGGRLQGEAS